MAKLIRVNGNVEDIQPKNGKDFDLSELTAAIGCEWIELVNLSNGIMVIDEEGKLNGKEYNAKATAMCEEDHAIMVGDYIVGDALVCKNDEIR